MTPYKTIYSKRLDIKELIMLQKLINETYQNRQCSKLNNALKMD